MIGTDSDELLPSKSLWHNGICAWLYITRSVLRCLESVVPSNCEKTFHRWAPDQGERSKRDASAAVRRRRWGGAGLLHQQDGPHVQLDRKVQRVAKDFGFHGEPNRHMAVGSDLAGFVFRPSPGAPHRRVRQAADE